MREIKKAVDNKKILSLKNIVLVLVVMMLTAVTGIFVFGYYYVDQVKDAGIVYPKGMSASTPIELTEDIVLAQTFLLPEGSSRLDLLFATYTRVNQGELSVRITEDGVVICDHTIDVSTLIDNGWYAFQFDRPLKTSDVSVTIISTCKEGNAPALWGTTRDEYANGQLSLSGKDVDQDVYFRYNINVNEGALFGLYWVVFSILMLGALALTVLVILRVKVQHIFLTAAIVIGFCYMIFFPISTVPDEMTHIFRSYQQANQTWELPFLALEDSPESREDISASLFIQSPPEAASDVLLACMSKQLDLIDAPAAPGYYLGDIEKNSALSIQYVFSSLGLSIGRWFGMNAYFTLMTGRLLNLLFYIIVIYFAIKIVPFGKTIFAGIGLLPITIHLGASYSSDAVIVPLALLCTAYWLNMIYGVKKLGIKHVIGGCILNALFAPCKSIYILLCFLCLLIPVSKCGSRKRWLIYQATFIGAAVLSFLFISWSSVSAVTNKGFINWANEAGYTPGWVISNPISALGLFCNTIFEHASEYLLQMFGGSLAWLNFPLPFYCVFGFIVLLLMSMLCPEREALYVTAKHRTAFLLVTIVAIAGAAAAMFFGWTPLSYKAIAGIQGRYFLPVLPLFCLALRSKRFVIKGNVETPLIGAFGAWQVFTVFTMFASLG